ncbi:MAG: hypothetical protein K2L24_03670, partial [Opitutales bacterium]|nr:hypothetical protein [Opitutales bacterium]
SRGLLYGYKRQPYSSGDVLETNISKDDEKLCKEYLSQLEYYLDFQINPKFGENIQRSNRFIAMSLKGEIDLDQILELLYILNSAVRVSEVQEKFSDKVMTKKDPTFTEWFLEAGELTERVDPDFLKTIRGEPCALRDSFGDSLESVCQEYLDAAQEYLNAWPDLKPLQGRNSLVDQKCCISTVIDLESSAKCGIFRERMRKMEQDMVD